ncbi:977_t:CDS:2, partial [Gigaspora margarita]
EKEFLIIYLQHTENDHSDGTYCLEFYQQKGTGLDKNRNISHAQKSSNTKEIIIETEKPKIFVSGQKPAKETYYVQKKIG